MRCGDWTFSFRYMSFVGKIFDAFECSFFTWNEFWNYFKNSWNLINKQTFRLWPSSFFFIFTGLSSSSSKLFVDATLESALEMLVEFITPALGMAPNSIVEFGVARDIAPFVLSLGFDWLLLVALGVLLFWPREFDVESGTSSDGSSHPWHDFFELESANDNHYSSERFFFVGWKLIEGHEEYLLTYCMIACHRHLWSRLCSSPRHRFSIMSAFCASFVCFGTRLWPAVMWLVVTFSQFSANLFLPVARLDLDWPQFRFDAVDTSICWSETPFPTREVGCSCKLFADAGADRFQPQNHLEKRMERKRKLS